jgi:hypothetical protein
MVAVRRTQVVGTVHLLDPALNLGFYLNYVLQSGAAPNPLQPPLPCTVISELIHS